MVPTNDSHARLTHTVFYDADCGVCRHTARALRILDADRRLRFIPLQDFVPDSAADPTRADLEASLHVRDEDGGWHAGGAATLRIASVIPILMPLAVVGRLPGMGRAAEAVYDLIARHRHAVGHWLGVDHCTFQPDVHVAPPSATETTIRPS